MSVPTGERIRDKIAASKAKGMWMGGTVPLGYEVPTDGSRALVLNEAEATAVRTIFKAYLELGSVPVLQRWLDARGIRSKRRITRGGRVMGGLPFSRGALFHLLRNRTYLGLIVHQHQAHPGRHAAIVETALFDTVQAKLDTNARRHNARSGRVARAPLTGRIFDIDGQPMSPSFTHGQRGQVYRYYVSAPLQPGRRDGDGGAIRRVPGPALEDLLSAVIRRIAPANAAEPLALPVRVEVHAEALQLLLPVTLLATVRTRLDTRQLQPGIATRPGADQGAAGSPCNARRRPCRSARARGCAPSILSPPPGTPRLSCPGSATRHPCRAATAQPHARAADAHPNPQPLVQAGPPGSRHSRYPANPTRRPMLGRR